MSKPILTEDQQNCIEAYIIQSGLQYDTLKVELLDHLCCEVEDQLALGKNFGEAWDQLRAVVDSTILKKIEHQTLLEINQTIIIMKKIMLYSGSFSAVLLLFGAFFKTMHWPGANIMLVLGSLQLAFVFLPTYFYYLYAQQDQKRNKLMFLLAFLAPFLIVNGFLFKTMHWPWGTAIALSGLAALLVGFIPLFLYKSLKTSTDRAGSIALVLILIISVPILYFGMNPKMSGNMLNAIEEIAQRDQRLAQMYGRKNNEGYLMLHTLIGESKESKNLSKVSDEFCTMLESLRIRLKQATGYEQNANGLKNPPSVLTYYNLSPTLFSEEEKKALIVKNQEFYELITLLNHNLSSGFKSNDYFTEMTGGGMKWIDSLEQERPAIDLLSYLSQLQTAIRATEAMAINQMILQHQFKNHPKATEAGL